MKQSKIIIRLLLVTFVVLGCVSCSNKILDPKQTDGFNPVPAVNVILPSLGVADEPDPTYDGAEEPKPEDLIEYEQDYVLGIGDVVRISIYELRRAGLPYVNDYEITETGRVSIPDVGQVRAVGLTEKKLEDEIKDILSPSIIKDPAVTVLLLQSQSRIFSIVGQGVARPGRYSIPRYTFRLTDAIAIAGDVGQFNVTNIFLSRDVPADQIEGGTGYNVLPEDKSSGYEGNLLDMKTIEPSDEADSDDDILDLIKPYSQSKPRNGIVITSSELATEEELMIASADEGIDLAGIIPSNERTEADQGERIEWINEDGKWKPVRVDGPGRKTAGTMGETRDSGGYGWDQPSKGAMAIRVIKIPVDRLKSGDPRYDIIIRPGDRISVPVDIIGEFWVSGNVNSVGPIPITGRPITLKMAIASAGGLNELASPNKVEVIRRLGRNKAGLVQEEAVLVDLDKIASFQQPDFFIKPNDLINVGTHGTSRWLAVLRNAFRATYGFGFIYDRNFADRDADDLGDPLPF